MAAGVNALSSPFCLSVQEMGQDRLSDACPKALGTEPLERHEERGFVHANVSLDDISVREPAITSLPLQSPFALCKALPCTSELSDVSWQPEGSGTTAGLSKDLAKITLGSGAPPHLILTGAASSASRKQFLNQY